jgi:hypothetical protein
LLALVLVYLLLQLIDSVLCNPKFAGKSQEQTRLAQHASSRAKDPNNHAVLAAHLVERLPDGPLPHNSTAIGPREIKLLADALNVKRPESVKSAQDGSITSSQDGKTVERKVTATPVTWSETFQPIPLEEIVEAKFASAETQSPAVGPGDNSGTAPSTVSAPEDDLLKAQLRLHDLGFLSSPTNDAWDASSRKAVREFKLANGLTNDDVLDTVTREKLNSRTAIRADESLFGSWCRPADEKKLRLTINSRGAKSSAGTKCVFEHIHAENGSWRVRATCSGGKEKWTANGHIKVKGSKLAWASEGDVVNYLRCN